MTPPDDKRCGAMVLKSTGYRRCRGWAWQRGHSHNCWVHTLMRSAQAIARRKTLRLETR